jgi:hypothetical protein
MRSLPQIELRYGDITGKKSPETVNLMGFENDIIWAGLFHIDKLSLSFFLDNFGCGSYNYIRHDEYKA